MANENMIKFYRGLVSNLPATGVNGALYITTDEGAIYYGTGTGMKRLGDFIQVANVAALPEKAHESCLYYCVAENILAKWNGTEWKQINKQPTAEDLKGLLGLGALAYKSEVAEADLNADLAAKINASTEANHGHENKTVLDGITAEKVAAWDGAEAAAKAHADGLNTAMNTRVEALEAIDHEHANKALLDTYTQTEANLADAVAKKHSHNFADEAAISGITAAKVAEWDDAVSKEHTHTFADADVADAISKKHSHTFVESELNKIVAGDVAKWNGVVADHLTAADKTAIEDSIGDVNTALENYKTSNNEALAGVKATADAAATKEYTDAELAKKVNKTDYEADKATFATKTELGDVDAKFADYNTTVAQKAIDDAQDAEIAKKVAKTDYEADKATFATKTELNGVDAKFANYRTSADQDTIDNGHKERIEALEAKFTGDDSVDAKIAAAVAVETQARETAVAGVQGEVDAVEGRMDTAEGKITALETASATHALKTEVEAIDKKFEDYTKTADLPTDLGDFTNNAGYAKTADVNTELAKKADKTQVATDIANAIAPLATAEALNGVKATAEAAAVKTEVEDALALKADKSVVDAMYTNGQIDDFIAGAKSYADGLITDANLDQYTTEQEVKDIVDGVIAAAADDETYNSLTKLIDYVDAHKGEAIDMAEDIADHETRIGVIEGKPAYGITATQISNWDNEVGAKALAETKTTTAEVKAQIEAYGYATTDELAAEKSAREAKEAELAEAIEAVKVEASNQDAVVLGEAQAYADAARDAAIADADGKINALAGDTYTKDQTFTKDEVSAAIEAAVISATQWGEF